MSPEAWDTYWVGIVVGLFSGLLLGFITWRLPTLMNQAPRRQRKRDQDEQELRAWHERLLNTPLRSMEDIQADREPTIEQPVIAVAMLPEPAPPLTVFKGPPIWRLRDWLSWSYGDIWRMWSNNSAQEQDREGQRVVRTL